ncbi:hypothetical protein EDF57_101206 [Novosphingobium sp. PhB55]|uniref:DUF4286 family protein n=1 Tax=Novosphingobium sp. PhB55 TaxID=2485106 RepID=UPI00106661EB|nr:DUF4286 family protein [Novosphingobium sp. PhB55]TDW68328.1 hypothetical protein EDF57_101206 [Novosphingobium sp. PhB55]
MPKYKLIALTTPKAGREEDYHHWYDNNHLPELVNTFGMTGAQRYELVARLVGNDSNPYLAIYDIETDDPMVLLGAIGKATAAGQLTQSDAQDMGTCYTALFTERGDRVTPAA